MVWMVSSRKLLTTVGTGPQTLQDLTWNMERNSKEANFTPKLPTLEVRVRNEPLSCHSDVSRDTRTPTEPVK